MKHFVVLARHCARFGGCLLAASVMAATPSLPAVFPELSHDFGTVKQGDKLVHAFVVRNT